MTDICVGCGARLQSEDEQAPGFLPESARNREAPLCRRCFRIRHYGEVSKVGLRPEQYAKAVAQILERPGLVLYVLDVFDLEGSWVPGLTEYIGNSPVVAVVNKVDLLPQDISAQALRGWVVERLAIQGIRPVDVCFVSAHRRTGLDRLWSLLGQRREPRVYAVGMANVGKSSLLNRLVELDAAATARSGKGAVPFTASRIPGTTLGLSEIRLSVTPNQTVTLLDTPGLVLNQRLTDVLCADCLAAAVPSAPLRPRVFQLTPPQTLLLGGLARLDLDDGPPQTAVCYVSNDLVVHRTKRDNADAFVVSHADDILRVPCATCRAVLGELAAYPVQIDPVRHSAPTFNPAAGIRAGAAGCDIVLPGLGWLALSGPELRGRLQVPAMAAVTARPRLIGDLNRPQGTVGGWTVRRGQSADGRDGAAGARGGPTGRRSPRRGTRA
ncbi:MAG: 50S ribosome-binding GTPase [Alicyclobacillus sp.]|nr:50S ribosome-binding GTPase [Alicyclobacillus sp.]